MTISKAEAAKRKKKADAAERKRKYLAKQDSNGLKRLQVEIESPSLLLLHEIARATDLTVNQVVTGIVKLQPVCPMGPKFKTCENLYTRPLDLVLPERVVDYLNSRSNLSAGGVIECLLLDLCEERTSSAPVVIEDENGNVEDISTFRRSPKLYWVLSGLTIPTEMDHDPCRPDKYAARIAKKEEFLNREKAANQTPEEQQLQEWGDKQIEWVQAKVQDRNLDAMMAKAARLYAGDHGEWV